MEALFDQYGEPAGWIHDGRFVLDSEGNYGAFILDDRIYSYGTGRHVGFSEGGVLWSLDGGGVVFLEGAPAMPSSGPLLSRLPPQPHPAREPITPPLGDMLPRPPLRGWSEDALSSFFMAGAGAPET